MIFIAALLMTSLVLYDVISQDSSLKHSWKLWYERNYVNIGMMRWKSQGCQVWWICVHTDYLKYSKCKFTYY